ncbi:MFS transporter [Streptomyces sp. CT34]|uniref:MFS transporter n=1 Tax=Streptomyces sp. CT34 TaxID=1553907 RepID=UPI0007C669BA|nr:MFS transporter [Streptomyces sp. CT34]
MGVNDTARRASERATPPWLLVLLATTFVFGTGDYVVAGILPETAKGLAVSEAVAGQLISAFSIVYAVSAPILGIAMAKLPRKTLITVGLAVFALANFLGASASSYGPLLIWRVLAALAAGAATPAALAAAGSLSQPERRGRALAAVSAGLTASLIAGVPVGTWIGGSYGWRATFVFVGGVSLVVLAAALVFLPAVPSTAQTSSTGQRLGGLARLPLVAGLLGTAFATSGGLMFYTYIAPAAREAAGATSGVLAVIIAVAGAAGLIGPLIGGKFTDSTGPRPTLTAAFAGCSVVLFAFAGTIAWGHTPAVLFCALGAAWAITSWGAYPPTQLRLLTLAGDSGNEPMALYSSAIYLGTAVGGAVGGALLTGFGVFVLPLVGAVLQLIALALYLLGYRSRSAESPVAEA